jgi:cytochrome b
MALRTQTRELRLPMPVWDAPVRLFHWLIVALIMVSYVSVRTGRMRLHLISGFTILALLLVRLAWGFIGSDTARFSQFLKSPLAGLRHLGRFRNPGPDNSVGHNEAGGWMVLVMLLLLAVQVGTGLCANDDGATEGPLAKYVGKANSDWLSGIHVLNFKILVAAIVLHVLAVFAYTVIKRQDLIRPMITGRKRLPAAMPAPRMVHPGLALAILVVVGVGVWVLATRV